MAFVLLGAFVVLVAGLSWFSYRKHARSSPCYAPADPRDDLRMRCAFDD